MDSKMDNQSSFRFPRKLHQLLRNCEQQNECCIFWLPGGHAFQVHDKGRFAKVIMPRYFKSADYRSFQRNLNLWGWKTVSKDAGNAIYHHELFQRNDLDLCRQMTRCIAVVPSANTPDSLATRPNLTQKTETAKVEIEESVGVPTTEFPSTSLAQHYHHHGNIEAIRQLSAGADWRCPGFTPFLFGFLMSSNRYKQSHSHFAPAQIKEQIQNIVLHDASGATTRTTEQVREEKAIIQKGMETDTFISGVTSKESRDHAGVSVDSAVGNCDIVPCRARGMPLNHNCHTAFFVINRKSILHGANLVCSHITCCKDGTKFRYCSICKVPASKKTFAYFHSHRDNNQRQTIKVPAFMPPPAIGLSDPVHSSLTVDPAGERLGGTSGTTPPARSDDSVYKRASMADVVTLTRSDAQQNAWDQLLYRRPSNHAPQSAMLEWISDVLKTSDMSDD